MSEKLTNEQLLEIGRKVVAAREKQRVQGRERRRIKARLYELYKNGELGDIKV